MNFQILVTIFILRLASPIIEYLNLHEINEQAGYVEIKLANAHVASTDIIVHTINTEVLNQHSLFR